MVNIAKNVAIILAAGIGSRLRPETYEKPKCLVNVMGQPILEYQLHALESTPIDEIIIVTGYMSQKVAKFIRNRKNRKFVRIVENQRYFETNNMYSLSLALDTLSLKDVESVYVINGDIIIEDKIAKLMVNEGGFSAIAVDTSQYFEESMKVVLREDGTVADISKNISPQEYSGVSIDFYRFTREDLGLLKDSIDQYLREGFENLWTESAIQRMIKERNAKIWTVDITGLIWWEIDNKIDKSRAEYRYKLLKSIDALKNAKVYAFDLDGTLILGKKPIKGAIELVNFLISIGKKVYFITNNSSMPNEKHYERLIDILKIDVTPEAIFSSLDYIGNILSDHKCKVYALLPQSSKDYLSREYGIQFTENDPDVVIVGFDTELTYEKLQKACQYIQNGAKYYLIHPDIRCPIENGFIPDAGSIGKIIELVTGKSPELIGGKPNPAILKELAKIEEVLIEQVCYIGDRLDTDIKMAMESGAIPILFLTGETEFEDIYYDGELKSKILLGEHPMFLKKFLEWHLS